MCATPIMGIKAMLKEAAPRIEMDSCFGIDAIVMVIFDLMGCYSAVNRLRMTQKCFNENALWRKAVIEGALNGARVPQEQVLGVAARYFRAVDERLNLVQAREVFRRVELYSIYVLVDSENNFESFFEQIRSFIVKRIVETELDGSMHGRRAIVDTFRSNEPIARAMIARAAECGRSNYSIYHNPESYNALSDAVNAFPEPIEVMVARMMKTCFVVSEDGVVGLE